MVVICFAFPPLEGAASVSEMGVEECKSDDGRVSSGETMVSEGAGSGDDKFSS